MSDSFEHDIRGPPLFPTIDEDMLTAQEVRQLLQDFIEAQWGKPLVPILLLPLTLHSRLHIPANPGSLGGLIRNHISLSIQ